MLKISCCGNLGTDYPVKIPVSIFALKNGSQWELNVSLLHYWFACSLSHPVAKKGQTTTPTIITLIAAGHPKHFRVTWTLLFKVFATCPPATPVAVPMVRALLRIIHRSLMPGLRSDQPFPLVLCRRTAPLRRPKNQLLFAGSTTARRIIKFLFPAITHSLPCQFY